MFNIFVSVNIVMIGTREANYPNRLKNEIKSNVLSCLLAQMLFSLYRPTTFTCLQNNMTNILTFRLH